MSGPPYTPSRRDALLDDLNPAQREAVTHAGGALLVVAGAGTGKTRVLTRRVAWIVAGGLPARSVIAITFTNKAADVMKQRLAATPAAREAWAGTFHAFCARVLRRHGDRVGIPSDYTVLDREDQRRLLRDLLRDLRLETIFNRPAAVAEMLSHLKNGGGGRAPLDLADSLVEEGFVRVREAYAKRLRAAALLDFDDLLLEAYRLLDEVEEVGDLYRRRLAHVLVDEYQDTNVVQAALLHALLGPSSNLTVVGDPDQSIYRWRGAAVRNILEFEDEYPGARRIVLERNYRSTKRILDAAERVVARNVQRHEKTLYTENGEGESVRVVRCGDPDAEAETVASILQDWQAEGLARGEMAVFYRVNSLSRAVEMALRTRRVPYAVVAGVEFFHRREVKDVLAYARLVENPNDDAAFMRIANVPRRGVGDKSLTKLRHAAMEHEVSCFAAARADLAGIKGRARKGLAELAALVDEVGRQPRAPVAPLLERILQQSGYREWLAKEDESVELSRTENADELIAYAHAYDRTEEEGDLRSFLERTVLVSDQDALESERDRVSLMSVHAAKGLEFDGVVIVGAEEDLFPHARNAGDPASAEEERRLFYVAMTRARKRLAITHSRWRNDWRGEGARRPSPYLTDLPAEGVRVEDRGSRIPRFGSFDPPAFRDADVPSVVRDVGNELRPGDRVRHPHFGEGCVADRQGSGADLRVAVDFDHYGRRQLLFRHARLERIS